MRRALAATLSGGLMACATDGAPPTPPPHVFAPMSTRLVQQGYGEEAHFAYCLTSDCPQVTPKKRPGAAIAGSASGKELAAAPQQAAFASRRAPTAAAPDEPLHSPTSAHTTVGFAFDQSALGADAVRRLDALLHALPAAPQVTITGYTDSSGPQPVNDRIALARARAVAAYLRTRTTLRPDRIEVSGRGRCCYVASNETPEGRARNRRVEIAIAAAHVL